MNSFDASTYETLGEAAAYQLFWRHFGQKALLALLASHGNTLEHPLDTRKALCSELSESLRVLRAEMQFPLPPETPPEIAKIAGDAFHKTLRHLEDEFLMRAAKLSPDLVPAK